jgi:hypothetical protein
MITGELAANLLCAGRECVDGAATALMADKAKTEPTATHETFNHDWDIVDNPQLLSENLRESLTQ